MEKDSPSSPQTSAPADSAGKGVVAKTLDGFGSNQRRVLTVGVVIALAFGAYFLRHYLELIAFAGVLTYLFRPLYVRIENRWNSGLAATLTLLSALAIVIVPIAGVLTMAGVQIKEMLDGVKEWVSKTDLTALGHQILDSVNHTLGRIPFLDVDITPEKIQSAVSTVATSLGDFALNFAKQSVGGIAGGVTAALIFLYVFLGMLGSNGSLIRLIKNLSPLDPELSDVYLSKVGDMVKATVGGQFVIALAQGTLGAISIYVGGIHQGFFMFVIFLTVLSIIPLGSGIVTIPLGIGMAFTGNITGGLFVALFHVLVTSNIDNVLRPMLIPRNAHLAPALMILSVFAGLSMFGFAGIVFGPVIMIMIVTTIDLYVAVRKGGDWRDAFEEEKTDTDKPGLWARLRARFGNKHDKEVAA